MTTPYKTATSSERQTNTGQEIARQWNEWIESPDGKSCADIESLNVPEHQRQYLKNRLWHAFTEGAKAGEHAVILNRALEGPKP